MDMTFKFYLYSCMKIVYSLLILVLITASCKKDSSDKGIKHKTYLLVKATNHRDRFTDEVETYTYDDKNRVTELRFGPGLRLFKYTYDDKDRVSTVLTYGLDPQILYEKDVYTYHDNFITAQRFDPDGFNSGSNSFTLNPLNQVTNLTADNLIYKYDSKGNAISYVESDSPAMNAHYTFDDKKHPLSMIAGNNVHLMFLAKGTPITHVNNILTDSNNTGPYVYTYNSDGFPTSFTITSNDYTYSVTYEYMVK